MSSHDTDLSARTVRPVRGFRFRVLSLDPNLAQQIRSTRRDLFGGLVESRRDPYPHQCRVCLQLTQPEEEYLLFSHCPFENEGPYSERGPVFIHARVCEPHTVGESFPSEFPRDIVLRAYDERGAIIEAELCEGDSLEQIASDLLAWESVSFLHARNRSYGCFMYRVELGRSSP